MRKSNIITLLLINCITVCGIHNETAFALSPVTYNIEFITEATAKELIIDLLTKAATVYGSVFNGSGHFKEDRAAHIPGFEDYALVIDDNIKSVADLKAWIESVITPEIARIRFYSSYLRDLDLPLSSFDKNIYRPLYYDYEGRIYVDTGTGGHGFAFKWLFDTIKITSITDTVITAEIDRTLFNEFDETSNINLEKHDGQWLIANDFVDKFDEDISMLSILAFEDILTEYPPEEGGFEWSLISPDRKAEFFWGGNIAGLYVDTRPFEAAGLDVSNLEGSGNSVYVVYYTVDRDPKKTKALFNFRDIVFADSEKINYDAEYGYFGLDIGDGNTFKWKKEVSENGMDVIFELNPKPLIEAGLDPNKAEGWDYVKCSTNTDGIITEEWKLIKSF